MSESSNPPHIGNPPLAAAGALSGSDFPEEVFECPQCGQMLAPTCRVCVSCKQPIDPAQIKTARPVELPAALPMLAPEPAPVRFSWTMFFGVLAVSWLATLVALRFLGLVEGQIVVSGLQLLTAVWVFWDARQKMIQKPLRWGLGSLVLWIVIFPWYLVRRQKLEAPCPFVEAESGPFIRVILLVVFILFLLAVILSTLSVPAMK
jgi:hypothetical protein